MKKQNTEKNNNKSYPDCLDIFHFQNTYSSVYVHLQKHIHLLFLPFRRIYFFLSFYSTFLVVFLSRVYTIQYTYTIFYYVICVFFNACFAPFSIYFAFSFFRPFLFLSYVTISKRLRLLYVSSEEFKVQEESKIFFSFSSFFCFWCYFFYFLC